MKKCLVCEKQFQDIVAMDIHLLKVHNRVRIVTCKFCKKKIPNDGRFDRHLQYAHGTNHWDLRQALKGIKNEYSPFFNTDLDN